MHIWIFLFFSLIFFISLEEWRGVGCSRGFCVFKSSRNVRCDVMAMNFCFLNFYGWPENLSEMLISVSLMIILLTEQQSTPLALFKKIG